MTITQMECFVEAARCLNFTKAADHLYISQQTISRQIRALEKELGFPLFERRNVGVKLTAQGGSLYLEWRELLERLHSSVDQARDLYYGEQKLLRIGVSDMGNIVSRVSRALLDFNVKYPDLSVEYEVGAYPAMRQKLEEERLNMLITFGAEITHEHDLNMIRVSDTSFRVGIILSRQHPLARKRTLSTEDIQYETLAVLSDQLSVDHRGRVEKWFLKHGIYHPLNLMEFHSFHNLQIALATGKCVGAMYERVMDGMEDKLVFYPLEDPDTEGAEVVIAWKHDKYAVKAKNIARMMEEKQL